MKTQYNPEQALPNMSYGKAARSKHPEAYRLSTSKNGRRLRTLLESIFGSLSVRMVITAMQMKCIP
jgi:hypothetical protein